MCWQFEETEREVILYFTTPKIPPKISDELQLIEIGHGFQQGCERAAKAQKNLVVDFRGVEFIWSPLIGEIVLLNKAAVTNNVKLRIVNVGPNVFEVFKRCNLDRLLLTWWS